MVSRQGRRRGKNRRRTAIPPARHEPAKTGSFLFHPPVPEPAKTGSFPLGTLRILMSRERSSRRARLGALEVGWVQ